MIANMRILLNMYLSIGTAISELYIVDEPLIKVPKIKQGLQLTDQVDQRDCLRGFFGENIFSLEFSFDYKVINENFVSLRLDKFVNENGRITLKKFMKKTIITEYFKGDYFMPKIIPIHREPSSSDNFSFCMDGHTFNSKGKAITNGPIVVTIYKDLECGERTTVSLVKETIVKFFKLLEISDDGELEKFGYQFIISTASQEIQTSMFKVVFDRQKYSIKIVLVDFNDYHLE